MAIFSDLQKRLRSTSAVRARLVPDEVLVKDQRAGVSPSTMVDRKLRAALAMRQTPAGEQSQN